MQLTDAIAAALRAHAEAVYPAECCGLVVEGGDGLEVVRGRNLRIVQPSHVGRLAAKHRDKLLRAQLEPARGRSVGAITNVQLE